MKLLLFTALFVLSSLGTANSTSRCKPVTFQVTGTAQNRNLTGVPLTALGAIVAFYETAPIVTVTGTQTLSGTYCAPSVRNKNNDRLQVFFSSITADRNSWSALGGTGTDFPQYKPEKYSWVDFANKKGYATLAIDRLGTGKSSHPDPIIVVQAPYEIALYNNLAQQIKDKSCRQLPRRYTDLTYIGNSYGAQLGGGIANSHPDAYSRFILTGFSYNFQQSFLGVSLVSPAPAQTVDPARFGTLPPGYLTMSSQTGRTNSFFGSKAQVGFEDAVADLFFKRKDVVSIGQFVSIYALTFDAPKYTGPILVLTGEQDQAVCGPGSPVIGPAACGPQLEQTGALLFPAARYNWKSVDRTGHAISLHLSAPKVLDIAHRWLAGETFTGGPPA